MVFAFFITILIVGSMALCALCFDKDIVPKKIYKWFIFVVVGVTLFSGVIEYNIMKQQINAYNTTKYIYETALYNDDLTGLERLNIVESIVDKNEWLSDSQHYASQWYGFHLPREILDLEYIKIGD